MAATAEQFANIETYEIQASPDLYVAENEQRPNHYIDSDTIPELQFARMRFRLLAEEKWETNMQLLRDGQFESVLPPIDVLGTARQVVAAERQYGKESQEASDLLEGLRLDSRRLRAEAFRKRSWEYFPKSTQHFNPAIDEFMSHGVGLTTMTDNGLSPAIDSAEIRANRLAESVEERTSVAVRHIGRLALAGNIDAPAAFQQKVKVRTISQCSEQAIQDYQTDIAANNPIRSSYGGHVPEINKLMIRDTDFDFEDDLREQEQLGMVGTYMTPEVIHEALEVKEALTAGSKQLSRSEMLGKQWLVDDDIFEFAELLDTIAGRRVGKNLFMGEEVEDDHAKDYGSLRDEARMRQDQQEAESNAITDYVLGLARQDIDAYVAEKMVEKFVTDQLLKVGRQNPEQAAIMFDDKTAEGFRRVKTLEERGDFLQAELLAKSVETAAPPASFCAAGSCGLEGVIKTSDEGKDLSKKLRADSGDTIVKDKERACKCGKKEIVYAYNKHKVNKLCTACGAFESKRTA